MSKTDTTPTRRDFLATTAALSAAVVTPAFARSSIFTGGSDVLRVGLIGCGGRGSGAAKNCIDADPGVQLVALGDMFEDRLNGCHNNLKKAAGARVNVPAENRFVGFDAYKGVLETDVDLVILATPPGFRPIHLAAAIDAGKNVFAEKPVAVDPTGIRSCLDTARKAKAKGLAIVTGTQRRHQKCYIETIKRIQDGAIGEVVSGQCYWNQGGLWHKKQQPNQTEMEWQLRNWLYFTWLSGDHIVEQHIHNIDVMNWCMGSHPLKAYGMGGRETRTDPMYGHIFDHFAIEFTYPNGGRVMSFCRQQNKTQGRVGEHVIGTNGMANPANRIKGPNAWRYRGKGDRNPYVQEHVDLIASIRSGNPLNELQRVAESTMCAIMGRMAAYTGREVTWDFAMNSKLDLVPKQQEFGDIAMPAVAVPGKTPLV